MLKYVQINIITPLEAIPPLYSKINDISGKNESQKEQSIKAENIYCVGIYPQEVVILGGRGLMWKRLRPVGGGRCHSVINSP